MLHQLFDVLLDQFCNCRCCWEQPEHNCPVSCFIPIKCYTAFRKACNPSYTCKYKASVDPEQKWNYLLTHEENVSEIAPRLFLCIALFVLNSIMIKDFFLIGFVMHVLKSAFLRNKRWIISTSIIGTDNVWNKYSSQLSTSSHPVTTATMFLTAWLNSNADITKYNSLLPFYGALNDALFGATTIVFYKICWDPTLLIFYFACARKQKPLHGQLAIEAEQNGARIFRLLAFVHNFAANCRHIFFLLSAVLQTIRRWRTSPITPLILLVRERSFLGHIQAQLFGLYFIFEKLCWVARNITLSNSI